MSQIQYFFEKSVKEITAFDVESYFVTQKSETDKIEFKSYGCFVTYHSNVEKAYAHDLKIVRENE